ncbi:unnamed protein product [Adineta ricciae]|uniref:Uncharacterized protein n=1 Tax=Adineta ricciae TaxID=249248 RepID=A0A816F6R9_ADIRI|nr:unnamed protein product [Adineta ricciae]CAF1655793.1 unnamed protein product [Adineta ricciae]
MKRNADGVGPQHAELLASFQEAAPINRTDISNNQHQQSNQNSLKRAKEGDDSFEREHRLASGNNKYFYYRNGHPITITSTTTSSGHNGTTAVVRQASFPPFKINFVSDEVPKELAIIKDINNYEQREAFKQYDKVFFMRDTPVDTGINLCISSLPEESMKQNHFSESRMFHSVHAIEENSEQIEEPIERS